MNEIEELKTEVKTSYKDYLLPILCLAVGILIGFLLSPIKSGHVTFMSGNTLGSNNGSKNSVADMLNGSKNSVADLLTGRQKNGQEKM